MLLQPDCCTLVPLPVSSAFISLVSWYPAWDWSQVLKSQGGNLAPSTTVWLDCMLGTILRAKYKRQNSFLLRRLIAWHRCLVFALQSHNCSALYILEHPNNPSGIPLVTNCWNVTRLIKPLSTVSYLPSRTPAINLSCSIKQDTCQVFVLSVWFVLLWVMGEVRSLGRLFGAEFDMLLQLG